MQRHHLPRDPSFTEGGTLDDAPGERTTLERRGVLGRETAAEQETDHEEPDA
jgi:hypothetical protein